MRNQHSNVCALQLRSSLGLLATPFAYLLVIIVCTESIGGPAFVMSDTAIVAASLDDGDYGRQRFWACLAWASPGRSRARSWAGRVRVGSLMVVLRVDFFVGAPVIVWASAQAVHDLPATSLSNELQ